MDDAVDAIMRIMTRAFDPAFGEAWNRWQVSDALAMPNTYFLLADANGTEPVALDEVAGFAMSRGAADEEELLLIAVLPEMRGRGVGTALLDRFAREARARGVARVFLEMREGNRALDLYLRNGFATVGRRRDYYRSGNGRPIDALTLARTIA